MSSHSLAKPAIIMEQKNQLATDYDFILAAIRNNKTAERIFKRYLDNILAGYCSHSILNVTVVCFYVAYVRWFPILGVFFWLFFFNHFTFVVAFSVHCRLHNNGVLFSTKKRNVQYHQSKYKRWWKKCHKRVTFI